MNIIACNVLGTVEVWHVIVWVRRCTCLCVAHAHITESSESALGYLFLSLDIAAVPSRSRMCYCPAKCTGIVGKKNRSSVLSMRMTCSQSIVGAVTSSWRFLVLSRSFRTPTI